MAEAKTKPDLVYHYCDTAAFMSIVANERIWCTSAEFMNDTLDCHIFDDIIGQWVDKNAALGKQAKEKIRGTYLTRHYRFIPFVACFSFGKDLLSQWRGYADDGRGFAIGFDKKELSAFFRNLKNDDVKNGISTTIGAKNVIYNNSNIESKVHAQLNKLRDEPGKDATAVERQKTNDHNYSILAQLKIDSAFYKQKTFSEEKEFRLAVLSDYINFPDGSISSHVISSLKFRRSPANLIVSYYEVFFPKPKEILIGPKNGSTIEQIYFFLNNSKHAGKWKKFEEREIRKSVLTLR